MKKKTVAIVIIGLVAVIVAAFSHVAAAGWLTRNEAPPPPSMSANPEDVDPEYVGGPKPEIPVLTESEEARAVEIALSDPRVQELIEGKEYEIGAIGVWHTDELEKIGAGLHIWFDKPYWIEYNWPLIEYNEEKYSSPYYREGTFHYALPVQTLGISLNLEEGRVVAIRPMDMIVGR